MCNRVQNETRLEAPQGWGSHEGRLVKRFNGFEWQNIVFIRETGRRKWYQKTCAICDERKQIILMEYVKIREYVGEKEVVDRMRFCC